MRVDSIRDMWGVQSSERRPHRQGAMKSGLNILLVMLFVPTLVFLQSGYTYYLSFQILGMICISGLIISSQPTWKIRVNLLLAIPLFTTFLVAKAASVPMVVSRNSDNIALTAIGILVYAILIISFPNFKPRRVERMLMVLKSAAATTIVTLSGLLLLSHLDIVPSLNRFALLLQNNTLVTNFSAMEALQFEMAFRMREGLMPRVDLFYGEPSFLAIVLFICAVCYLLTVRVIAVSGGSRGTVLAQQKARASKRNQRIILSAAVFSLLYVQSLSSIIYAFILIILGIAQTERRISWFSTSNIKLVAIALAFLSLLVVFSYDMVHHRIMTMNESLSFFQRFETFFKFGIKDYLLGLSDESKIPDVGFHNGLFYLIAISGVAGLTYLWILLRTAYQLAKPIRMSLLLMLAVMAAVMQNGAIFSPNKVVLFALIFLPLSCARTVYGQNARVSTQGAVQSQP